MAIENSQVVLPSARIRRLEQAHAKPIAELLRELYYAEQLTAAEIGARLGAAPSTVLLWMSRYGVHPRQLAGQKAQELAG